MVNNKYEVVDVFWRSARFNIQVVRVPEDEVENKLALISREGGVPKVDFDNFLVQKCLIDLERVGRHIAATAKNEPEEISLIEELVGHIIEVNPMLAPELLVISDSGLIKIPSDTEVSTRRLVDNPRWHLSPSESVDTLLEETLENLFPDESSGGNTPIVIKNWDDVGITLKIFEYSESDLAEIFKDQSKFYGPVSYRTYVVRKCLVDFNSLLLLLDSMGITSEMQPPEVVGILYDFSIEHNPFLKLENVDRKVVSIKQKPTTPKSSKHTRRGRSGEKKVKSATAKKQSTTEEADVKDFSGVPKKELLSLGDRIKSRVIGQTEAVDVLVNAIQIAGCGLRDPAKPIGAFLFTGATGVGKTFCAKILAHELVGPDADLVRIDCSEYGYGHEISRLVGAPPGYLMSDQGGTLTNKIIENPFSVILFDEIEKAHSKVYDLLLQVLDDGRLTDGKGVTVDFSDCVIIMTSNLGVKDVNKIGKTVGFGDYSSLDDLKRKTAIDKAIKRHFKPEFLNRLDSAVMFNSLGKEECLKIVALEFKEISGYLNDRGILLRPTKALKQWILDEGFSSTRGARQLRRTIEKLVIKPLAAKMLSEEVTENSSVRIDYRKGEMVFNTTPRKANVVSLSTDSFE